MPDQPPGPDRIAQLSQAMGMVAAQADCTAAEALGLINDRATVEHCTSYEIAVAVLERRIRFGE